MDSPGGYGGAERRTLWVFGLGALAVFLAVAGMAFHYLRNADQRRGEDVAERLSERVGRSGVSVAELAGFDVERLTVVRGVASAKDIDRALGFSWRRSEALGNWCCDPPPLWLFVQEGSVVAYLRPGIETSYGACVEADRAYSARSRLDLTACSRAAVKMGRVGVLARPATSKDRLPANLVGTPLDQRIEDHTAPRLARITRHARYFVVPTRRRSLCLVKHDDTGAGIACDDERLLRRGMIVLSQPMHGRRMLVSGIVPDGFQRASIGAVTGSVVGNVFEVAAPAGADKLVVTGPGAKPRTTSL